MDNARAELYPLYECLESVDVCIDNLRVAGAKSVGKGAKSGAFGIQNDEIFAIVLKAITWRPMKRQGARLI